MRPQSTLYEILGVEPTATPEEIKRQYRRLAKRYHPDVAGTGDAAAAQRAFVEVTGAYEVLCDARRRASYDQELALQRQRAQAASAGRQWTRASAQAPPPPRAGTGRAPADAPPPRAGTGRTPVDPPRSAPPPPDPAQIVYEARLDLAAGRIGAAQAACQSLLQHHPQHPEAHALLGDVYRVQGRFDDASRMYRLAVQLSVLARMGPEGSRSPAGWQGYWLARAKLAVQSVHPVAFVGWLMVLGLLLLPAVYPGAAVAPGLRPVSGWTDNLILGMVGAALLTGFLTTWMGVVGRLEGDIRANLLPNGPRLSVGAVLLPASIVLFPIALLLYLGLLARGMAVSRPLAHVLAMSASGLILFALAVPAGGQTLLLGGNVIFPCMVLGSLAGGHCRETW